MNTTRLQRSTLASLATLILCLLGAASTFGQDYSDWKFTHPKPQPNQLRKIQMIDANTWVAVGANGTFMRTTDAGAHWYFHQQAGLPANNALNLGTNFDLWFTSGTTGLVVGARGYVGKTTDAGVTFTSIPSGIPTTQSCKSISFPDANTGYIASAAGSGFGGRIIKSTNGGASWAQVFTTSAAAINAVVATDAMTAHAVLTDGSIINTTDGGASWSTPVPNTVSASMLGMSFLDSMTGFVVGSQGTMNKTTDGGVTWAALPPPQTEWAFFQMKIFSATEIYAVGDADFLYKSTDLGQTWTPLPIFPVSGPADTLVFYTLDRQGSLLTMSGDFGVIAQSIDGGVTWSSNNFSLTVAPMEDIKEVPNTNTVVAVGVERTIGARQVLRSTDLGNSWTTIDVPLDTNLMAVSFVNSQLGYACGTNSQVVKTTDAGLSWAAVTQPVFDPDNPYTLATMDFVDANTGWVAVNFGLVPGGNIFKTTDGGMTWAQQTTNTTDQVQSIDMVDANLGYLSVNFSGRPIFKTTNGGTTWSPMTTPFPGQITKVRALDANLVYLANSAGTNRVGKSTDGGATWQQIALPITVDVTSLDFKDANTGYVSGNLSTAICRTTDGGGSWSFQNVHVNALIRVYAGPSGDAWALGTSASILRFVPLQLTSAVSRKTHGANGTYDVNLPLTGNPGVESRADAGGNHTLVLTFNQAVTGGSAAVSNGTGNVSGSPAVSGNTMTVNLAGVADQQLLTLTVQNATTGLQTLANTNLSAGFLVGDANADKVVNSADATVTRNLSGQSATAANFRADYNVDGTVNSADATIARARSGNFIPSAPASRAPHRQD